MKLPRLRDLTDVQRDVYLYAPNDSHVLVAGPPGTGKTLIACFRAVELQKREIPVILCMFNRVLAKFASNAGEGHETSLTVMTVRRWFQNWWNKAGLPPRGQGADILLNAGYDDRLAVRDAGARWHRDVWAPWKKKAGAWVVALESWRETRESFAAWTAWQEPPLRADYPAEYDWDAICSHVIEHADCLSESSVSPGTLLIDEGQDFPPGFYQFLYLLSAIGASRAAPYPLKCMVLADENQQLTEFNSTLSDIQSSLRINDSNRYQLLDNFRNTREIAELARRLFADVGVMPRLPEREGEVPAFVECNNIATCVRTIMTWVANHPGKETGVLVFKEHKREMLQASIKAEAAKLVGRHLRVQSYSWGTRSENSVDELVFDAKDVITVLNMQSCKGLEFDAVFIVDLHDSAISSLGGDRFRMQMFVAVSRARQWVELLESSEVRQTELYLKELPDERYLRRRVPLLVTAVARQDRPGTASAATTAAPANRVAIAAGTAAPENWETGALVLAKKNGWAFEDLRPKGCFWLYAPTDASGPMLKLGFRYSARRNAWWRN
jgi:DNA polymerase III delta prime subunit